MAIEIQLPPNATLWTGVDSDFPGEEMTGLPDTVLRIISPNNQGVRTARGFRYVGFLRPVKGVREEETAQQIADLGLTSLSLAYFSSRRIRLSEAS